MLEAMELHGTRPPVEEGAAAASTPPSTSVALTAAALACTPAATPPLPSLLAEPDSSLLLSFFGGDEPPKRGRQPRGKGRRKTRGGKAAGSPTPSGDPGGDPARHGAASQAEDGGPQRPPPSAPIKVPTRQRRGRGPATSAGAASAPTPAHAASPMSPASSSMDGLSKNERKRIRRRLARAENRARMAEPYDPGAESPGGSGGDSFSLSALDLIGTPLTPTASPLAGKLQGCSSDMPARLPPEPQEGNTEYKLKLVGTTAHRFEHLVTQMKWRLAEGGGEALYEIGVADDGSLTGLSPDELAASLHTLEQMAAAVGAHTKVLRSREGVNGHGRVAEVHVRRVPDDQQYLDLRVACVGGADTGKSTLLGVLTSGELDNGRGKARLNLFRHHHEIKSGRTSSLSCELLGFDGEGRVVNFDSNGVVSTQEVCERSSKIVTFIDFPGHQRYMKTTIKGLTGREIDYVALVVSGASGVGEATKEHLDLALAINVPVLVIVTKIDVCSKTQLTSTLDKLMQLLKSPGVKKIPFLVSSEDDAYLTSTTILGDNIAPIFMCSSVTGKRLDILRSCLNLLPTPHNTRNEALALEPAHFQVEETFQVHNVGPVVAGTLLKGTIRCGESLSLGPLDDGSFCPVCIVSAQRNRRPHQVVRAGQRVSFALEGVQRQQIRAGQVLLDAKLRAVPCWEFEANVFLVSHPSTMSDRFQVTVYIGSVRQTAQIVLLEPPTVAAGDNARVRFRFTQRPEFAKEGAKLVFRENRCKGIGTVTRIVPLAGGEGAQPR